MRLEFSQWGGIAPRIDPLVLPSNMAETSHNFNPLEYLLKPFHTLTKVRDLRVFNPQTIYLYDKDKWFEFDHHVDIAKAPISNDKWNYVVICDDDEPKITRSDIALSSAPYPAKSYSLGLPQPQPPTASAVSTTPPDDITDVDYYHQSYVITMVDGWGRESAASFASNTVTRFETATAIQTVNISWTDTTGDFPLSGRKYRIYRSATSAGEYSYLFLGESLGTTFADKKGTDDLLEPLETAQWFAPPTSQLPELFPQGTLRNVCVAANSFLCGNTGNTVCYSESGVAHAWPPEYYRVLPYEVVALAPIGTDILALTKGYPYLLSGTHPSVVAMMQITDPQACISKQSVVSTKTAVIYASPDGLCVFQNGQVEVITRNILKARQWSDMNPKTLKGWYHDGLYYGKTSSHSFVVNPGGDNRLLTTIDFDVSTAYVDMETDTLYMSKGTVLSSWNSGDTEMELSYKSGFTRLPNPTNFAWASVRASAYPVDITIHSYRDGGAILANSYHKIVTNDQPFIMPSGFSANAWQIEITTKNPVINVILAHSRKELQQ